LADRRGRGRAGPSTPDPRPRSVSPWPPVPAIRPGEGSAGTPPPRSTGVPGLPRSARAALWTPPDSRHLGTRTSLPTITLGALMDGPVRVLVVDDSPSTRTMLREALSLGGGIEVVGEAGDGRHALFQVNSIKPDVVLMDVRMPDMDGVTATRSILSDSPNTKVVALTWSDDPSTVRDMLSAGAIGYVVKGGTIDELAGAIRRAAGGEPELDQRVIPAAVEDLRRLLEEERERREQIERLARARAEFVQVLSHELRSPLTVISGALKMLAQGGPTEEGRSMLDSALRRAGELEFLV